MPSSATITAFYFFTAGSYSRSSEVNYNFGLLRGHLLSIDGSLSSASNKSYDLGSSDHRWNGIYSKDFDLSNTTTSELIINGLSSGSLSFKKNGTQIFAITSSGYVGFNTTPMPQTTTADIGSLAMSQEINELITSGAGTTAFISSSLTISTVGRRVAIGLVATTTTGGFVEFGNYTGGSANLNHISILRVDTYGGTTQTSLPPWTSKGTDMKLPGSSFFMIDKPPQGLHSYWLAMSMGTVVANQAYIQISGLKLVAWEF